MDVYLASAQTPIISNSGSFSPKPRSMRRLSALVVPNSWRAIDSLTIATRWLLSVSPDVNPLPAINGIRSVARKASPTTRWYARFCSMNLRASAESRAGAGRPAGRAAPNVEPPEISVWLDNDAALTPGRAARRSRAREYRFLERCSSYLFCPGSIRNRRIPSGWKPGSIFVRLRIE